MSTVNSNSADSTTISGFLAGSFPDLSRALWRRAGSHFAAAGRWAESAEAKLAAGDLQAAADPLLVRDLQEKIAAWQPRSALRREREKLFAALNRWSDE